jgi:hypothetical protein
MSSASLRLGPRSLPFALLAAFAALGAWYAFVVPPGEAPDEPAHLAYINTLIQTHALPIRPQSFNVDNYEFFQPPLDYVASAFWLSIFHSGPLTVPFSPDPHFSFHQAGSRAFLPITAPAALPAIRTLLALRLARLPWGVATTFFVYLTALFFVDGDPVRAALSAAPFIFAPQFLFVSATVNSDAALATLGAISLYCLVRCLGEAHPSGRFAAAAGIAAALALFAKASGLLLAPPLGLTALCLLRRRQIRPAAVLLGAYAAGLVSAAALALLRFGSLLAPIPAGRASVRQLLLSPHWAGSLWVSFWAKFGWLNTCLPWPLYLLFLPPTCLVLMGLFRTPRSWPPPKRLALAVMRTAALSNLAFVLAYLAMVDWQAQGRYLFPSLAAFAALSAAGLSSLPESALARWRHPLGLTASLAVGVALAATGALEIQRAYKVGRPLSVLRSALEGAPETVAIGPGTPAAIEEIGEQRGDEPDRKRNDRAKKEGAPRRRLGLFGEIAPHCLQVRLSHLREGLAELDGLCCRRPLLPRRLSQLHDEGLSLLQHHVDLP